MKQKITRFQHKKTYAGRSVKKTRIEIRNFRSLSRGRKLRQMRPTRKRG